jgi:hypothetical protein
MVTPTSSDFDVRIKNPEISPIVEWDDDAAKFANGNHGEEESVAGAQSATINFSVRLGMGDNKYTPANWGKYFNACGIKDITWTTAGLEYKPLKEYDQKTITIWVYDIVTGGATPAGIVYKFAGCMGNVTVGCDGIGKPWIASFAFTGKCVDIADVSSASLPVGMDFDTAHPEKFLNSTLLIDSVAQCVSKFQLDVGNEISPLICQSDLTGYKHYQITNRKPRFSCDPIMQSVATEDIWANMISGLTGTEAIDTAAAVLTSNNFTLTIPKAQRIQSNLANREGIINLDANFRCLANGWTGALSDANLEPEATWSLLVGARS